MTHINDWIPIKSSAAWIDPNGEVNLVDFYDHAKFFKDHPDMKDAYNRYKEGLEENQRIIDDDLASLAPDEHPAMHRFAGMDDDTRDKLYKEAYENGWLRLGVYIRNYQRKASTYVIEVYGVAEFLDKFEDTFVKLGRDLSASVTFFYVVKRKSYYSVFDYKRKKIT